MRTAEERTLLVALFTTKYRLDSYLYVFLRCLINLDWHDSLFFPWFSFHARQGVLSHNSNLQSVDFLQTEQREESLLFQEAFFYKEIKARTTLESPNGKSSYNWRSQSN